MNIETKDAIAKAGSSTAIAELLGLTKGAVSQWGEFMPTATAKQLLELRPHWYPEKAKEFAATLQEKITRLESADLASVKDAA